MTLAESLLTTARSLNEKGEALDNFEYVRGQAELIVDALGYSQDEAKYAVMAYLAYELDLIDVLDVLYGRTSLSHEIEDKIDRAHKHLRIILRNQGHNV